MKKMIVIFAVVASLCGLSAQANEIRYECSDYMYDWSGAGNLIALDSPGYTFRIYTSVDSVVDFSIVGGVATSGSDTERYSFTWNDTAVDAGIFGLSILDSTAKGFSEGSYVYGVLFSTATLDSGYCAVLVNPASVLNYPGNGLATLDPTGGAQLKGGLQGAGGDWQAVPEPATFGLMAIGAGVAWLVRLKQRA